MRPPVPVVVRRLLEPLRAGRATSCRRGRSVAPCVQLIHTATGDLPGAATASSPSASSAATPDLHLDPVRRRHPPLPRRQLRGAGDETGAAHGARRGRPATGRSTLRGHARRSAISFSPDRRGRVIAEPRRRPAASLELGGLRWRADKRGQRHTDRRRRRQGGRRSRPRSHAFNRLGLGPISNEGRRGDRGRRLVEGAQRDDLGRGAAGGHADQGHRLPVPELPRVRRGRRRDRRGGDDRSPGSATWSDAGATRAGSTRAPRRCATATTAST